MMIVKKTELIESECVVRGYLAGSGWKEYQESGTVCGHKLPEGLRLAEVPRLRHVSRQNFSFSPGIDVTDVRQVKGLEFDYVSTTFFCLSNHVF